MSYFRKKFGLPTKAGYVKGVLAKKLKDIAEQEIQKMSDEFPSRLRVAINEKMNVRLGDISFILDDLSRALRLDFTIHITNSSPEEGSFAPSINIVDPNRLRKDS